MESIEIDLPAREKKSLVIDGTEYLISPYIDINDMSLLANCEEENDCRSAIVRCILLRINSKEKSLHPDLESFVRKSDATITEFCKLIVESDGVFRKYYTNQSEEINTFCRFALAAKEEQLNNAERMRESIDSLQSTIRSVMADITASMVSVTQSMISDGLKYFSPSEMIRTQLANLLSSLCIPTISEERKKQIEEAHRGWGQYGWTQPLDAPDTFLDTLPDDSKDATKKALSYCDKISMDRLFSETYALPHAKKSDLKEAIFDFEHRQYKSCVIILFSLIDARLIRLQRKQDISNKGNKQQRRAVGKTAVKCIFDRISKEQSIERKVFMLFTYQNLLSCLSVMFADTKDFSEQYRVINRNLVDHGMLRRKVIRKDCVQLFLLYYNLLSFLDLCLGGKDD